jgi:hypothetical protein
MKYWFHLFVWYNFIVFYKLAGKCQLAYLLNTMFSKVQCKKIKLDKYQKSFKRKFFFSIHYDLFFTGFGLAQVVTMLSCCRFVWLSMYKQYGSTEIDIETATIVFDFLVSGIYWFHTRFSIILNIDV